MRETLIRIYNTLNRITVQGRDNLDQLLGCMQAIQALIEMESSKQSTEEGEEESDG